MKNIAYLKLVAESLKAEFSLDVKIKFKNINRGRAGKYLCSIPKWATKNKYYGIAYVLHELTHYLIVENGHGEAFKTKEKELLARFKMVPEYRKAYIGKLFDNSGKVLADYEKEILSWTR